MPGGGPLRPPVKPLLLDKAKGRTLPLLRCGGGSWEEVEDSSAAETQPTWRRSRRARGHGPSFDVASRKTCTFTVYEAQSEMLPRAEGDVEVTCRLEPDAPPGPGGGRGHPVGYADRGRRGTIAGLRGTATRV